MLKDFLELRNIHPLLLIRHRSRPIFQTNLVIFTPLQLFHNTRIIALHRISRDLIARWRHGHIKPIAKLDGLYTTGLLRLNNNHRVISWIITEARLNMCSIKPQDNINRRRCKRGVLPVHIQVFPEYKLAIIGHRQRNQMASLRRPFAKD
jgi:hypothetical protein